MKEVLTIRIATMRVVSRPAILVCRGLGSCVGVSLWEPRKRVGGMIHILLPTEDSSLIKEPKLKFADKAVPALIEAMERRGCKRADMVAKIAGGSGMFRSTTSPVASNIGERNIVVAKEMLYMMGIEITGEDIGKSIGRNMAFDTEDGTVTITTVAGDEYTI